MREYGAELVVVATGSRWAGDGLNFVTHEPIPGADPSLPHVLTPEQVMLEGKQAPGGRVVVFDADGYFMGAGLAERLRAEGRDVEIVTPHDRVAPVCDETLEGTLLRQHLHDLGIGQRPGIVLTGIEPGRLTATDHFGDPLELEADAVVLVTQRLSDDALYRELQGRRRRAGRTRGSRRVYRIGDCVAPRIIAEAIFDGHRLGARDRLREPGDPAPVPARAARARPGRPQSA